MVLELLCNIVSVSKEEVVYSYLTKLFFIFLSSVSVIFLSVNVLGDLISGSIFVHFPSKKIPSRKILVNKAKSCEDESLCKIGINKTEKYLEFVSVLQGLSEGDLIKVEEARLFKIPIWSYLNYKAQDTYTDCPAPTKTCFSDTVSGPWQKRDFSILNFNQIEIQNNEVISVLLNSKMFGVSNSEKIIKGITVVTSQGRNYFDLEYAYLDMIL